MYLTHRPRIDRIRQSTRDVIWKMRYPMFSIYPCNFLDRQSIFPEKLNIKFGFTKITSHEEWQDTYSNNVSSVESGYE